MHILFGKMNEPWPLSNIYIPAIEIKAVSVKATVSLRRKTEHLAAISLERFFFFFLASCGWRLRDISHIYRIMHVQTGMSWCR